VKPLRLDRESLSVLRIVGAIWFFVEWLVVAGSAVVVVVVLASGEMAVESDGAMRFENYLIIGGFIAWMSLLTSVTPIAAVALLRGRRSALSARVRVLCRVFAAANALAASWYAYVSAFEVPATDFFVIAALLASAALGVGMAVAGPSPVPSTPA
jgi:hypothetical protein